MSAAPAKNNSRSEDKAEVVPASNVVHLIHMHTVGEKADDESDHTDQPVPQPGPETRRLFFELLVSRCTARCNENKHYQAQRYDELLFSLHCLTPSFVLVTQEKYVFSADYETSHLKTYNTQGQSCQPIYTMPLKAVSLATENPSLSLISLPPTT